ncbi:MAG: glycosyltransferase family 2 protein [Bacteroidota bacterium]|jgi:glycosyltransferase involved in cell wall biosynthesis
MEKLSIVVCVYNEELNIKPLVEQIYQSLKEYNFELIYVDDGSTDNTVSEIKSLNKKEIHLVELRKNYGQSSALAAGIDYASGEYIITMDGDLQNDPSDIPAMLEKLKKEELDLVAGIRKNRQDGMFLRKIPSKIANAIIRMTTDVRLKDYGCTLKVFRKDTAKSMGLYGELHRFIPVLVHLEGGKLDEMNVKHHPRIYGKAKYGINRTFKVVSDLLLMLFFKKYMQKPMHLFGNTGVLLFMIGILINIYLLALKIMGQDIWGKPLLILGVIMLLAGIQLITVGLMAEMQMRTYYESQEKKPYKIRRVTIGNE